MGNDVCPSCGHEVSAAWKYCPWCGYPLTDDGIKSAAADKEKKEIKKDKKDK